MRRLLSLLLGVAAATATAAVAGGRPADDKTAPTPRTVDKKPTEGPKAPDAPKKPTEGPKTPVAPKKPTEGPKTAQPKQLTPKEAAINETWACAQECLKCMKHCRDMKMEDVAKMCETCHHSCLMTMLALQANSPITGDALAVCEKVCNECAKMCEKHNHPETKKCAEECHKCAKACAAAHK